MNYLEFIAVLFGIASVWYARQENIRVFPAGIINVLLFIYIFLATKLYANAAINLIYLATNLYGWYNWSKKNDDNQTIRITRNSWKQNMFIVLFAAGFYVGVLFLLRWLNRADMEYIDSSKSWLDAMNSSFFLCATILMAIKKIENWMFWIAGNVVSIPIFLIQGLYFTSFQYLVFLILAISGLNEWRKKLKTMNNPEIER